MTSPPNRNEADDAPVIDPDPPWPVLDRRRVVFLLDASSALERRLLVEWIERHRPDDWPASEDGWILIPPTRRRRRRAEKIDPQLENELARVDDPDLIPLRVAWRARERGGVRDVRFADLLRFGDPRDPSWLREHWIVNRHPDRVWIVVGESAPASSLRARWRQACGRDLSETTSLPQFVVRQAGLALDRAERRVRGLRYKVPRFLEEDILRRPAFQGGLLELAKRLERSPRSIEREAEKILREIAATHSPLVIDLAANLIRLLYTQGYSADLQYDRDELEGIYALAQRYPIVFLPTHKSNLDHLVLQFMLHENGHPPNHTAGGINMNFFPIGPIVRRSGTFFIRRSFKDDELYKFVLHSYIDFLVEKRFPLEWYIEGGRSRSGKLLPPRLGMLHYVVEAFRRGKAEDVVLLPTSIAYDQIQDLGDYVREQQGSSKQKESFGWFVGFVRKFRSQSGRIHLNFGEPLFLSQIVEPAEQDERIRTRNEESLELQKLAFEVCVRINRVTPITPTSLVAMALLGTGDRALTLTEVRRALRNLGQYVKQRRLPTTAELDLDRDEGIRVVLDTLVDSGVVSCFDEGREPVWVIGPNQHLAAAYYRNTIIHFFVIGSIAELAVLRASEAGVEDREKEFFDEALELRDLFKFEFFFSEKDAFRRELADEVAYHDPEWRERFGQGAEALRALIRSFRPLNSHRVLRPFLEAYRVVADVLAQWEATRPIEDAPFLNECLSLGHQYQLQRRIASLESISRVLMATGLSLVRNRRLDDAGDPDIMERRREFADQLEAIGRRIQAIDHLAASRRAGLMD